jgi:hypothetical protein
MHTISIGDSKIHIPGNWNELTGEQLISMARIITENAPLDELKLKLLFAFADIHALQRPAVLVNDKEHFWIRFKQRKFMVPAQSLAFIMTPFIQFFSEKSENEYIVSPNLTRQLLPVIKAGKQTLYGPGDGLSNITLREFIFTETAFSDYLHANDASARDKLIAVLYRPSGKIKPCSINFTGDIRERFNDNIIDSRIKIVADMPDATKKAILWYYEGCKRHIAYLFPNVFREGNGGESTKSAFEGFMTIVDELANNQPADHERVLDVLLYSALNSLNQRIEKLPKNGKV